MLGMLCALVGSSTWLTVATKIGLPVSTTHCITGGVIGMGVATVGHQGIHWGWKGTGVSAIIASWVISPAIAGGFASIIFMITKYGVLLRSDPLRNGFFMVPIYFGITSGILTMLIVWKGAASLNLDGWTAGQICGCIFGVSFSVMAIVITFFIPWLHRKLVLEDWRLRSWEIIYGPLLLKRGPVEPMPQGHTGEIITNYYAGHATRADLETAAAAAENNDNIGEINDKELNSFTAFDDLDNAKRTDQVSALEETEKKDAGPWCAPKNLVRIVWKAFMHGVNVDVVASQNESTRLANNIEDMQARAAHYDNKVEHLYSFLQVLTAATSSFTHGANDVSNAIGPLSTIYLVWSTGTTASKSPVPLWVLAYGGAGIVIGLWTYGYNIMKNLGNRLTLMSPTRGFSMELGSAVTVVMATRLALPISTTQCIIGATMGVALCNGDLRALNWRMVGWCYAGWLITLPIAGIISGCLMGIIINAPVWNP